MIHLLYPLLLNSWAVAPKTKNIYGGMLCLYDLNPCPFPERPSIVMPVFVPANM